VIGWHVRIYSHKMEEGKVRKVVYPDPTHEFIYQVCVTCSSSAKYPVTVMCKSMPHKTIEPVTYRIEGKKNYHLKKEVEEALRYRFPLTQCFVFEE
jgi:hypothetical protein